MQSRANLTILAFSGLTLSLAATLLVCSRPLHAVAAQENATRYYLGFDRNLYPGDAALPILRKTFAFSSYWLSPPPGENRNTWKGKRKLLLSHEFGFLVLYRGRDSSQVKNQADATRKGTLDANAAVAAAKAEGFAAETIIFLDIEEGGRLPAAYHA